MSSAVASHVSKKMSPASPRLAGFGVAASVALLAALLLATPAQAAVPGTLSALTVTPASTLADAPTTLAFAFTLENPWPANGILSITLPDGYLPNNPATSKATFTGCAGATATNSGAGNTLAFVHNLGCAAGATVMVSVSNVSNPALSGPQSIVLRTQTPAAAAIDSGSVATMVRGHLTITAIEPTNTIAGALATYRFDITTQGPWPRDGYLALAFPMAGSAFGASDFILGGVSTINSSGCATGTFSFTLPQPVPAAQTLNIRRNNDGSVCPPGSSFSLHVSGIRNPGFAWAPPLPTVWTSNATRVLIDSNQRTAADGILDGSSILRSASAFFAAGDVGSSVSSPSIVAGSRIIGTPAADRAGISPAPTAIGTDVQFTVTRPVVRTLSATAASGATAVTAATPTFVPTDAGAIVTGTGITPGTRVLSVTNQTAIVLDTATSAPVTSLTVSRLHMPALQPGTIGGMSVSAANRVAGAVTPYTFTFATANAIPADGRITLVFPAAYTDMTGIASVATLTGGTGCATGTPTVAVSAPTRTVTITRGGTGSAICPAGTLTLVVPGVHNPPYAGTTDNFALQTDAPSPAPSCSSEARCAIDGAGSGRASLLPGAFTPALGVTLTGAPQASSMSAYDLQFTTTNLWPGNGNLTVNFPSGYNLASVAPADVTMTGCTGTLFPMASGSTLTLVRTGGLDCASGRPVAIHIGNVRNPAYSGNSGDIRFCTTTRDFAVPGSCGAAFTVDQALGNVTLAPALLTVASVATPSPAAGALTGYTLNFGVTNTWPANGKLQATFPAGYNLTGIAATAAPGGASTDCASGNFAVSAVGQTVTVTRSGGAACPAGSTGIQLTLLGVRNPTVSGTYEFPAGAVSTLTLLNIVMDRSAAMPATAVITTATMPTLVAPSAASPLAGALTTYTLPVNLVNPWPASGVLRVAFPNGYTFASPSATAAGCTGALTASSSGPVVTLTRGATGCAAGTTVTITLSGVRNPAVSGSQSLTYTTCTAASATLRTGFVACPDLGLAIDSGAPPAMQVQPALLTSLAMLPDSRGSGAATAYHFHFTLANPWPADGRFHIALPAGYTTLGASAAMPTSGCTGTLSTAATATELVLTRVGATPCSAGTAVTIDVTGIVNPAAPTISMVAFGTCMGSGVCAQSGSAIDSASVAISTGTVSAITITAADPAPGTASRYDFATALQTAWPADGAVAIQFPAGFGLPSTTTPTTTGCTSGTFTPAIRGMNLTLTRSGGLSCPAGALTLSIPGILNPATRGTSAPITVQFLDAAGNVLQAQSGQLFLTLPPQRMTATDTSFNGVAPNQVLAIQAVVRDATGVGVAGIPVAWVLETGSGTFATDPATGLSSATSTTDGSGVATTYFRTNGTSAAVVKATATGYTLQGSPLRYGINGGVPGQTIVTGTVSRLTLNVSATSLSADAGTVTLLARGFTTSGNALGDVTASTVFTVSPDGSCVGAVCTIRKAGPHTITATKSGAQATATISVTPGAARTITAQPLLGAARLAPGAAATLQAKVTDAHSNPVPGIDVAWAVATGSGTLSAVSSATGPDGMASVTLTTGAAGGANTVTASRTGLTPATFSLTTATIAQVRAVTASFANSPAGTAVPLQASVTDAAGTGIGGVAVTWTVRSGSGTLGSASAVTDATGLATATLTATKVGTTNVEAAAASVAPAAFDITTIAGPAHHLELGPSAVHVQAGQAQAFTVSETDQYGNVLRNVTTTARLAITPDGSCTGNVCTAQANGFHTVTATNGERTGTATMTVGDAARGMAAQSNASPAYGLIVVAVALLGAAFLARRK